MFCGGRRNLHCTSFLENLKVIIKNNFISRNIVESNKTAGAGITIQQTDITTFSYIIENNVISENITINKMNGKQWVEEYI
ncbi:MAG: hypothetical protein H6613_09645 [Ignavibacteriales bacterium]|nr:hypothetical protein [Ignavibacteriales bacterium]